MTPGSDRRARRTAARPHAPSTTLIAAGDHPVAVQRSALFLLAALVVAAPTALAHDEADAPMLREDVEAVWHEPEVPQPGTQWEGFIRFEEGHNVTGVAYQICRVDASAYCFAPPTPARPVDGRTWTFNTSDYKANDRPVQWGIEDGTPWRVGMKFILDHTDDTNGAFPHGVDFSDPECEELGFQACNETHYLAFDMPGAKPAGNDAPVHPLLAIAAVALALLYAVPRPPAGRATRPGHEG